MLSYSFYLLMQKSLFANWTNLVFTELNSKFQHTKVKVESEFFIVRENLLNILQQ